MSLADTFRIITHGDREIQVIRNFRAPHHLVFDAFTRPELVRCWLLGPPGWTMTACEIDLQPGGPYRYVWEKTGGRAMGLSGKFLEVVPPERTVMTEKFDQAWYPGEAVSTTEFADEGGGVTRTIITVQYESKEARDGVSRSDMEGGMRAGHDRLEELLALLLAENK